MSQALRETVEVEVRYAETDQMGVVHHANYLVWLELARTALCHRSGIHYAEIERGGHLLMVTAAALKYRQGARYGDTVRVSAWIEHLGSRGVHFAYEVRRAATLLATGRTEHVWLDRATGRPCRTPDAVRRPFQGLAEGKASDVAPPRR